MVEFQVIKSILEHATVNGSRSTVLKTIFGLISLLVSAALLGIWINAPNWVIIILVGCLLLSIGLFLFAFIYFMFRNPDALRSEKYSLQKMAIERGLVGDSLQGLVQPDEIKGSLLLPSSGKTPPEVIQ